ncbi:DNA replication factor C complex subunit Elg1 [Schizosaccharomyces japonicus yFS275]|uniref:DNA replication factor C complex subunit Elg1 n=1 Tax=Schizosaccharomyces japonicus (strain yFS275 / FY16936) TaxID=402676 RepID=B6K621_SCHJY|nr:DNA replication factor C complex subunit Elg1 [Schizosaccharomyces japonicus yFS275]EEB08975.2 DNA replication factor C complex subunit Elg1 [Schizosaccharomyces japonicus yFS275]
MSSGKIMPLQAFKDFNNNDENTKKSVSSLKKSINEANETKNINKPKKSKNSRAFVQERDYMKRFFDKSDSLSPTESRSPPWMVSIRVSHDTSLAIDAILYPKAKAKEPPIMPLEDATTVESDNVVMTEAPNIVPKQKSTKTRTVTHPFFERVRSKVSKPSRSSSFDGRFTAVEKEEQRLLEPLWPTKSTQTLLEYNSEPDARPLSFPKVPEQSAAHTLDDTVLDFSILTPVAQKLRIPLKETLLPETVFISPSKLESLAFEGLNSAPSSIVQHALDIFTKNWQYNFHARNLWTNTYAPSNSTSCCADPAGVSRLEEWLRSLKLTKPLSKSSQDSALDSGSLNSNTSTTNDFGGSESEFDPDIVTDDDSELSSIGQHRGFKQNWMLLVGPNGYGKTASVYALAKQLKFVVFEIHSGMRRSGKDVLDQIGELTQSHNVDKSSWNSYTDSLILLEEVDILFNEDRGFWQAVSTLTQKSKRPVIMTCNSTDLIPASFLLEDHIIEFSQVPSILLVDYVSTVLYAEGQIVSRSAIELLDKSRNHDLRAILMQLNFWCQSNFNNEVSKHLAHPNTNKDALPVCIGAYSDGMGWFNESLESEEDMLHAFECEYSGDLGNYFCPNVLDWRMCKPDVTKLSDSSSNLEDLLLFSDYANHLSFIDAHCSQRFSMYSTFIATDDAEFLESRQQGCNNQSSPPQNTDDNIIGYPSIPEPFGKLSSPSFIEWRPEFPLYSLTSTYFYKAKPSLCQHQVATLPLSSHSLFLSALASRMEPRLDPDTVYNTLSFLSYPHTSHNITTFPPNCIDRSNTILLTEVAPFVRQIANSDLQRINSHRLLASERGRSGLRQLRNLAAHASHRLALQEEQLKYLKGNTASIISTWIPAFPQSDVNNQV